MKKFLIVLLAVMMVLSTVSFAAPSAVGTMETANETVADFVDLAVEEDAAELAATAGDKSSYGTLVYKIDFDNADFDLTAFTTAYANVVNNKLASYVNPDFDCNNLTTYTNPAGDGFKNVELVTEGGNTYVKGDVNAGYSGFFRMTKYSCNWPTGYYTFVTDVKFSNPVSGWAKQCNDTAIATKPIVTCNFNSTEWQTVVEQTANVVNGADIYGFFTTPNNAVAGTVSYDNWEVYYRPATVKLTIGGVDYEVSTDNAVSADSLASKVKAPTGYTLSGLSLTEGGELLEGSRYFFEDTTLYPVFAKDTTIHESYGKPLFLIDFERAEAQTWWGHSANDNSATTHGAQVWEVATKYDPIFEKQNYRIRFLINESTHVDQVTKVENGNHFTEGTAASMWPQISLSNWAGPMTYEPGVYTFSVATRPGSAAQAFTLNAAWERLDKVGIPAAGQWSTIVGQKTITDASPAIPDSAPIVHYSFGAAGETVAFDNLVLYYKPLTADVTLIVNGKEYVAEDVATTGVSASSILEMAGVVAPYGTKPVLSTTLGGESVGDYVSLIMDSTYYVSFVADDSIHPVYGKRLLLIDLEKFSAGAALTGVSDNCPVSSYTDNYDEAFSHITVNWEVGANTIVEENGNKIIKGQQGWSQVRLGNSKADQAPAGRYTYVLKSKNYGYPSETKQIANRDQSTSNYGVWVDEFVDNGEWDEVAAYWDYSAKDYTLHYITTMNSDVAFDDIALYYLPASVELTVVNGKDSFTKTVANGITAEELLADVVVPFGYKVALSTTGDVADVITGALSLVSDTTLYVVNIPDEKVSFEYGQALAIVDFETTAAQGWDGNSQEINNSVAGNGAYIAEAASYADERFTNKNFRLRFVINETPVTDQRVVADENGNHYVTGTNTTQWPQVVNTNWGNVTGEAGVYTYMFDVKVDDTTESNITMGHGAFNGGNVTVVDGYSAVVGEWDTVVLQATMDAAGNLPKGTWGNFNFAAKNTTTLSFDNAKIYYKPFYATVKVSANGAVVATKENVSTSGVLVSALVEGVKVKGYKVVGAKLGTEEYALEDTMNIPCDCVVELILEVQLADPATPETATGKAIRTESPMGIRFKASMAKAEDSRVTSYGWIVTREDLLTAASVDANDFTFDCGVKYSVGYGRKNGTTYKNFFNTDDEYNWFTGVLYFSAVDDDGLPSVEKLAGKLIARPFAEVEGEMIYGDASAPTSLFDVVLALYYDESGAFNDLDEADQDYFYGIMDKVDANGNDTPDIWE